MIFSFLSAYSERYKNYRTIGGNVQQFKNIRQVNRLKRTKKKQQSEQQRNEQIEKTMEKTGTITS